MAHRDLLLIGTSAGGFGALRLLARELPGDLPAAVLVVIHLSPQFNSGLDEILSREGGLKASFAVDGERLEYGHIYIAPPQRHLLVDGEFVRLGVGPRENNSRPSVDPLFRSAALCCGPRAIGVILTGTMGDGATGLQALKQCGGIAVVQDPTDAAYPEMPVSAMRKIRPDHVETLAGLPALIQRLVRQPLGKPGPISDTIKYEVEIARRGHSSNSIMDHIGRRSVLACPDCNGVMWEIDEGEMVRYRCHVGHAYTAELLSLALDDNLQHALASALRALDERIALAGKLHQQALDQRHPILADSWARKLREAEQEANIIRDAIRRADTIASRYSPEPAVRELRKRAASGGD